MKILIFYISCPTKPTVKSHRETLKQTKPEASITRTLNYSYRVPRSGFHFRKRRGRNNNFLIPINSLILQCLVRLMLKQNKMTTSFYNEHLSISNPFYGNLLQPIIKPYNKASTWEAVTCKTNYFLPCVFQHKTKILSCSVTDFLILRRNPCYSSPLTSISSSSYMTAICYTAPVKHALLCH
jgi:hypothetical protein